MNLDDKICYCFHITRRKLVNYCRIHQPRVPSQLSQCGGAGTGCGWCIPFLKKIYQQVMQGQTSDEIETLAATDYAQQRADYVRAGKGTPATGAEPLPSASSAADASPGLPK
jgi:NAD(P)H-nitrite reductase large subunit